MSFYLFKFLLFLSRPWTLILLGVGIALRFLSKGKTDKAKVLLSSLFAFMLVLSLPVVSHTLLEHLESRFDLVSIFDAPKAEAIVVLGGTIAPALPPRIFPEELGGQRLSTTARLFLNHKAPLIIVSGGVPYLTPTGQTRTESTDMKDYLLSFGIPPTQIIEESHSRNTEENIRFVTEILTSRKVTTIILVTSAFHMNRAVSQFRQSNLQVIPFASEIRHRASFSIRDLVPSIDALADSTLALKEYLGRLKVMLL